MNNINWQDILEKLNEPFDQKLIQWRAGATTRDRKRAQALPYIDPREYEKRLDEVCTGAWGVTFKPWGEHRVICELTIHNITRSSIGEENDGFAPGTAAEAQAFKRACSKFGLGRYLYEVEAPWVSYNSERRELAETPQVIKFIPTSDFARGGKQPPRTTARSKVQNTPPITKDEATHTLPDSDARLNKTQAKSLHERIGAILPKSNQNEVIKYILNKNVKSFTELTISEAKTIIEKAEALVKAHPYKGWSDANDAISWAANAAGRLLKAGEHSSAWDEVAGEDDPMRAYYERIMNVINERKAA